MQIKANEHGTVRLFAIDVPVSDHMTFTIDDLETALGGVPLKPEHVDLFLIDDLDDLGLDGYLIHGLGIGKSEVVQLRPQLRALKGQVALIRSAAFGGMPATLTPKKPIRWIASFGEVPVDLTSTPLRSESAKGILASPAHPTGLPQNSVPMWMYAAFAFIAVLIFTLFAS